MASEESDTADNQSPSQPSRLSNRSTIETRNSLFDNSEHGIYSKIKYDGWKVLSEACNALAYSRIVKYFIKTDRVKLMYHSMNLQTEAIFNRFVDLENRTNISNSSGVSHSPIMTVNAAVMRDHLTARNIDGNQFIGEEYKAMIRDLDRHLREYLIAMKIEILPTNNTENSSNNDPDLLASAINESLSPSSSVLFSNADVVIFSSSDRRSNMIGETMDRMSSPSRNRTTTIHSPRSNEMNQENHDDMTTRHEPISLQELRAAAIFGKAFDL